jgi:hypothetical protein
MIRYLTIALLLTACGDDTNPPARPSWCSPLVPGQPPSCNPDPLAKCNQDTGFTPGHAYVCGGKSPAPAGCIGVPGDCGTTIYCC